MGPTRRGPVVFGPGGPEGPGGGEARRGPVVIEDEAALGAAGLTPETAPPVPEPDLPAEAAMTRATALAGGRGSWFGRLAWWAAGGLAGIAVSVLAWDFVLGLFARNPWLGRAALALGAVAAAGVLLFVAREIAGLARLARVDRLRGGAEAAWRDRDREAALQVVEGLGRLYAGRADLAWARRDMAERQEEALDAEALLGLAERSYLAGLDAAAAREIEAAARRVAVVTALVPLAFADVLAALGSNVAMIRRIAEIYGGRAGSLGSWRLMRAVAAHLIATGAIAVGDDMVGTVLGGGALTRLSRRFGEGIINAALTARVGVAAMEVCRPLPYLGAERPKVTGLVRRALAGFAFKG
ncbi:MAG TPA: TIGR01620 family protein [Paracoccaceae bacterium]|nr:TIGR01620 family protein [Paracoccaceae bacterium]